MGKLLARMKQSQIFSVGSKLAEVDILYLSAEKTTFLTYTRPMTLQLFGVLDFGELDLTLSVPLKTKHLPSC